MEKLNELIKDIEAVDNMYLDKKNVLKALKIAKKEISKQLLQADVSISLERAKKYARHQHFLGEQLSEFVEFEDWAKD